MPVRLALLAVLLACALPTARAASPTETLRGLMAERLALMEDVARSKWSTGAAIADPVREQALLEAGATAAARGGHDPAAIVLLLGAQIEAAKMVQERLFARWRAEGRDAFPDADGLLAAVRPEIARISAALVPAWLAARPELRLCSARAALATVPQGLAEDSAAWAMATAGATASLPPCQ